ncbi:MAG: flagellar motor protein MotB [Mobilitalea sp.]
MAKRKQKKHHEEEGGEAWLLPYSDLMTLLLAVFIVLFAVSQVDESKAEAIAEAFREEMMSGSESVLPGNIGVLPGIPSTTGQDGTTGEDTGVSMEELGQYLDAKELANLVELKQELDDMLQENPSDIDTSIDTRGLVISLNNAILFDSGSAKIKRENEDTLIHIAKIINSLDNYIRIEGHTDNIPITSGVYPSNWELSGARASSVVRLFIDECDVPPNKLVAVGYGEYRPIGDNNTINGRAKNRRIDIIVLSEKFNNLEDK